MIDGWKQLPGQDHAGNVSAAAFVEWAEKALEVARGVVRTRASHLGTATADATGAPNQDDEWVLTDDVEDQVSRLLAVSVCRASLSDPIPEGFLRFLERPEHGRMRDAFMANAISVRGPYVGGAHEERRLADAYVKLAKKYELSFPRVSEMMRSLAELYTNEARRGDSRAVMCERRNP